MMFTKTALILALFVWKTSICHNEDILKSQILTQLHLAKAKALHNLVIAKAKLHPAPHLLLHANPDYPSNSEIIPEDDIVTLNNNFDDITFTNRKDTKNLGNPFHNSADLQMQYPHQNYSSNFANYYEGYNQTEFAHGELSQDDFNFKYPMNNDNPIVQNDEYNLTNIRGGEESNNHRFIPPNYTNNDELLDKSAIVLPNQSRIIYSVDFNSKSNNTKARNDIDGIDIRKLKIYEHTPKIPNFPNLNLNDEKKSRKGHQDDLYEDDIFVSNDSNENSTESEDESVLKVKGGNLTKPHFESFDYLKDRQRSTYFGEGTSPIPDMDDNNDEIDDVTIQTLKSYSRSGDINPPVNKLKVPNQLGDGQLTPIPDMNDNNDEIDDVMIQSSKSYSNPEDIDLPVNKLKAPNQLGDGQLTHMDPTIEASPDISMLENKEEFNSTHPDLEIIFPDTTEIDLLDNSNSTRDEESDVNKKNYNQIQELHKTNLSEDPYDRLLNDDLDMISLFARTLNKDADAPMSTIAGSRDRFEKLPITVVLPVEQEKQTIDKANFNKNLINPIVTGDFYGYKEENANLNDRDEHFENLEDKEQKFTGPFSKTNINQQLLLRNAMLRHPNQQISRQYLTNPPQRSMSNQPIINHKNYPIKNEQIHLMNLNNILSSPHQDTTRVKLLNHEGPKLKTYDNSFYRLKQYIKGMQAHTLRNQRVYPQARDSDISTTDSFYPERVSSYLLHFPTNSDYFGARYRREIRNWSEKKERCKAHTLRNQRVIPQSGDSDIPTTDSFYPERVNSYLLHFPTNSDYFGAEEKRKAHTLKNQRVIPQPGDSDIPTTNSFYPGRVNSYLLHFPTNSDYFGARYRREIRNWSDKKEKLKAHTLKNQRFIPQPGDSDIPMTNSFYPERVNSYLLHFPTNSDYFGAEEKRKAHTLKNQRVIPQPGDSDIPTTNSFYPGRVNSYLLHFPTNSDYFGARYRREIRNWSDKKEKLKAHTLKNQRFIPQPGDSDIPMTNSFYPERVNSYLLHFPTNSDYFGTEEKRKAHTLKNQRVKAQPGDSDTPTTDSFYPEKVSSYLLHFPTNLDYFGPRYRREIRNWSDKKEKRKALPLISLIIDPSAKLDMTKTIKNFGTVTKNAIEDNKAPVHHFSNVLASLKNAALATMRIPPHDMIIPSKYKITDKNPQKNELVGSVQHEDDNVFHKVGTIMRQSIESGQEALQHVTDIAHNARKTISSTRHHFPKLLLPYAKIPAVVRTTKAKKLTLIAPRFADVGEEIPDDGEDNHIKLGHILDALTLSHPDKKQIGTMKITYRPKDKEVKLQSRFGDTEEEENPGQYVINNHLEGDDFNSEEVTEIIDVFHTIKEISSGRGLKELLASVHNSDNDTTQSSEENLGNNWKFTKEMMEPFMGILSRRKSDGKSLEGSLIKKDKRAAPASNYKEIENAAFANFLAGFEFVSSINPEVYRVYFHEPLKINRSEDVNLKEFQRDIKSSRLLLLPQPALLASRKDSIKDNVDGELVDDEKNLLGYNESKKGSK